MNSNAINSVLVVDDEPAMRMALKANFQRDGWHVETAAGTSEALMKFKVAKFPLVVSDVQMPDGGGLDLMRSVRSTHPSTAVILLTAFGNVPEAVQAMRGGACDYLTKPVSFEQLQSAVGRVLEQAQQITGNTGSAPKMAIVGRAPALLRAYDRARHAARTNADVLIQAESGTGKELLASFIHENSSRASQPFVAVNCAALPEQLLESELFGHMRGAFTGATAAKAGKFELAENGTLLLDEIGELPMQLQPKLLRALQERRIERLGDVRSIAVNIRVIATTNVSLQHMVGEGKFRADLYYRLNVIPLTLPPLRDRKEDIPALAEFFARQFANEAGISVPVLHPNFIEGLRQHPWPGNVRELANFMRRVVTLSDTLEIGDECLKLELPKQESRSTLASLHEGVSRVGISIREVERHLLEKALETTGGNRTRAAEMLGVSLRTIRNKIREYGLPPRRYA
ncbi:MAG TPA: sigma-54 dependent transcriptional regulator [Terriglobales bacterium]|nr:sigma-54 dependent transcriptional regulator [Terriglobales bacterium]